MACTPTTSNTGCFYDKGAAVFNVQAYASAGTDDAAVGAAITDIQAAGGGVLYFPARAAGAYSVTNNRWVPTNACLRVAPGAVISVASGKAFTVQGTVQAGPYQIFAGAGDALMDLSANYPQDAYLGYAEWWGITGTNDHVAIQKAVNNLRRLVLLPGKTYYGPAAGEVIELGTSTYPMNHTVVEAYGATVKQMGFLVYPGGVDVEFRGGTYRGDGTTSRITAFEVGGKRVRIVDVAVEAVGTASGFGTGVLVNEGAEDVAVSRCRFDGSGGSNLRTLETRGSRVRISDCQFVGSATATVADRTKGILVTGVSAGVVVAEHAISNCTFVEMDDAVSIGTRTSATIRSVTAGNLACERVGRALWIDAFGSGSGGGFVEAVAVDNVSVVDAPTGLDARYVAAVTVSAQFALTVRNVVIAGVVARVRGVTATGTRFALISSALTSGQASLVDGVTLADCRFADRYDGQPNGNYAGFPIEKGIEILDQLTSSSVYSSVHRTELTDVAIDGVAQDGLAINLASVGVTDAEVRVSRMSIRNFGAAGSSYYGVRADYGRVYLRDLKLDANPLITPASQVLYIGSAQYTTIYAEQEVLAIGTYPASQNIQVPAWIAPQRCYLYAAEGVMSASTSAGNCDLRAVGASSPFAQLASPAALTSKPFDTFPTAGGRQFDLTQAQFARRQVLEVRSTSMALSDLRIAIRYLPY